MFNIIYIFYLIFLYDPCIFSKKMLTMNIYDPKHQLN